MRSSYFVTRAEIPDVLIIEAGWIGDARGSFSETFRASALAACGATQIWVQDNVVRSSQRGIVRGLHFQAPPYAQAKIVRVSLGAVYDVVVDLRRSSPTYGRHVGWELSAENRRQIYVPPGFAHGYCTLSPNTETHYKTSAEYMPESEAGLRWDDPALEIAWPVSSLDAIVAERDRHWPDLDSLFSPF